MTNKINIKYMSDDTIETLRKNLNFYIPNFINYPKDASWINKLTNSNTFVTKKFEITDFSLKIPEYENDKKAELTNSIILYEHLKDLPMYVISDERFWSWVNFDKGYEVALKLMPVSENNSVIKDHWLFTQGKRRGLFFGVLSRAFLRVMLTVEPDKEDPYELTKFVIEKPERFRNLSWRTFSSNKNITLGTLKAEKRIVEELGENIEKAKYFTEIAKLISKLGSVMILDTMTQNEIQDFVYNNYKQMIEQDRLAIASI